MKSLKSFDIHLDELKKKPEFAAGFEEEKKRLGIALKIAEFRQNQKLTQAELAKR